ncbi:MYND-type zinc finger-containing chromatin reader ZMYND8-like [Uloborus diversus]|uniref:MYND-type zinc finger-containing chromatin reader ZMYND8-like n=1 Tax=Uloborus diversus TaxID=327109 RepID=UPI002409D2F2|nr:MYND-type zinc finger-containing chromatin reader ZMYND8-like [Uloborus diversus]
MTLIIIMRKCCVPNCRSNHTKPYVSVFTFPKDPAVTNVWLKQIGRPTLKVNENIGVCIKHFEKDAIVGRGLTKFATLKKKVSVKHGAVPTLFEDSIHYSSDEYDSSKETAQVQDSNSCPKMEERTMASNEMDTDSSEKTNSSNFLDSLPSPYKNLPSVSVCLKGEDIVEIPKETGRPAKRLSIYGQNNSSNEVKSLAPHPPKRKRIEKPPPSVIGRENDCFCWMCHKENIMLTCMACPRAYHQRCLSDSCEITLPDWVCPECIRVLAAEDVDTRSSTLTEISLDNLCGLLKLWVSKMRQRAPVAFHHPVSLELYPAYPQYVIHPMDLSLLENNIKQKLYGCTEAFLADVKWILHNSCVFNGTQHPLSTNARSIVKTCETDMQELEICPDCFKHSIIRNKYWFAEVCRKPHPLVWAKLKGFPYWPAKVVRISGGNVDARFFGAHDRAWVPIIHCYHLSKEMPTSSKPKKKGNYEAALDELNVHVHLLIQKFGSFEYAPYRTVFDPDNASLAYHGMDINKTINEDGKFDSSVTSQCEFDSPAKERFTINETESEMKSDSDVESKNQQSTENASTHSSLTENSSPVNEKNVQDSNLDSLKMNSPAEKATELNEITSKNIDDEENSNSSGISKKSNEGTKPNSVSEDPLAKSDSLDQLRKLELALERIKGYVCSNDDQEKSESNKEGEKDNDDSKVNTRENEKCEPPKTAFESMPTLSLDILSNNLDEKQTDSNTEVLNVTKKKDSFFLKLNETIESCKAKLGIDEIVEESSSENESGEDENDNSEDDNDAENSADEDEDDEDDDEVENAEAGAEEERTKNKDADETEDVVEEKESGDSDQEDSDSTSSGSEGDSNAESSETDIEEITVESNDTNDQVLDSETHLDKQTPATTQQKEIIEEVIIDSNEATDESTFTLQKNSSNVTLNVLSSENTPPESEKNTKADETDKSTNEASEVGIIDSPDVNIIAVDPSDKASEPSPSKTTNVLQNSDVCTKEKVTEKTVEELPDDIDSNRSDSNKLKCLKLSSPKDVDEDDDIYICPPVKPPTPPLICLDDCSETEPEGESTVSNKVEDSRNGRKVNVQDITNSKNILSIKNEIKNKTGRESILSHFPVAPKKKQTEKSSSASYSYSSSDDSSDEYDSCNYEPPVKRPLTGAKRTFRKAESAHLPNLNKTNTNPSMVQSSVMTEKPSSCVPLDSQNEPSCSSSNAADDRDNRNTDLLVEVEEVRIENEETSVRSENAVSKLNDMDEKDAEIKRMKDKLRDLVTGIKIQAWKFAQEKEELRHNMNLIIMEMRASLEMDKKATIESLTKKFESEKNRAIEEAKRKQWCANCLQESRYSCCWNTSYCTFNCQKQHFAEHQKFCSQLKGKTGLENRPEIKLKLTPSPLPENSENKKLFVVNVKPPDSLKPGDVKSATTFQASVPKSPIVVTSKNSMQLVKSPGTITSQQIQVLPNKSIQVVFSPKVVDSHVQPSSQLSTSQASPIPSSQLSTSQASPIPSSQLSTSQASPIPVVSTVTPNKQESNPQSMAGTSSESLESSQIIHGFRSRKYNLDTAISLLSKKNEETSSSVKKGDEVSKDKSEEHFSSPEKNSDTLEAVHLNTDELQRNSNDDEDKNSDLDEATKEQICESFLNERNLILSDDDKLTKDMVNIGFGIDVKVKLINKCLIYGNTVHKLTRCLVDALFPDIKLLATCSAYGQNSSTRLTKAALPARKVAAIIDFVQKRFPKAHRNEIVAEINLKCDEARFINLKQDPSKKSQVAEILAKERERRASENSDETVKCVVAPSSTTSILSSPLQKVPNVVSIKRPSVVCSSPNILFPRKASPNLVRYASPILIQPKPPPNIELHEPAKKRLTVRNLLDATKVDGATKQTGIVSILEKSKPPSYLSQPVPHQNYPVRPYVIIGTTTGKQSTSTTQAPPVQTSSSSVKP